MKSSAFKYVGNLWGLLPLNVAMIVVLVCGRAFRPDVMELWLCIVGSLFSLVFALLPVIAYLDAKRWDRWEKKEIQKSTSIQQ